MIINLWINDIQMASAAVISITVIFPHTCNKPVVPQSKSSVGTWTG